MNSLYSRPDLTLSRSIIIIAAFGLLFFYKAASPSMTLAAQANTAKPVSYDNPVVGSITDDLAPLG